jgi:hypothetical protein
VIPPGGEPTLAEVQAEYPRWKCWARFGRCYGRRLGSTGQDPQNWVDAEDPLDLRDQLLRADSLAEQAEWQGRQYEQYQPSPPP